ncbi:MAG: hypothetical protein H0X62_12370 [Bacteroidetes bacterium]|nr:hypothetical protein [Bacteroidota bacterium]
MNPTTTKTKEPHYKQVWQSYNNVKDNLCSRMKISDLEYYNREFDFGIELLNDYASSFTGMYNENFKKELWQNKIHLYWPFIKAIRRQEELLFWNEIEIVYETHLLEGEKEAANFLFEEWDSLNDCLINSDKVHESLRQLVIDSNI